jgi:homoserine trans-succinylase
VQFALAMQINIVNHTENPVIKLLARPMQINDVKVIKLLASSMHIASQHLRCIAAKPRPTEICLRILKIDQHLGKIDPHFHFSKIDPHFEIIDPHPKRNESLSGLA